MNDLKILILKMLISVFLLASTYYVAKYEVPKGTKNKSSTNYGAEETLVIVLVISFVISLYLFCV